MDAASQAPAGGRAGFDQPDGRASWLRLGCALAISSIGGVGMWSVVVALPSVQADFGAARAEASLPFVLTMLGFMSGGIAMGRLSDRLGIVPSLALGTALLATGYGAASAAPNLLVFALAHVVIGLGCSASFAPLLADISFWFVRRRGIAVAICASGNYLAGTIWPPLVQRLIEAQGWRTSHLILAIVCAVAMPPLMLGMRRKPNFSAAANAAAASRSFVPSPLGVGKRTLQALLIVAGIACCVAMSMPQVHIVAYCGDLGYGAARGAEMLALMMASGIVSRIASGFVADRIGGLMTLLIGSVLQGVALLLYTMFDGLAQLYVISALFGLFQGGIVPSYAIIVREYFPPKEAGLRVGVCIAATILGMALGGWMSGAIFDATGSYRVAFLNGLAWNLLNVAIAVFLLIARRAGREPRSGLAAPA